MEEPLAISKLNDFCFCPASIYYHGMYEELEPLTYKQEAQVKGQNAHRTIDMQKRHTKHITALPIYSEKLNLFGMLDDYDPNSGAIIESKRKIKHLFLGYIFQLYAQYYCLLEMGFSVQQLYLYSMENNKKMKILLPEEDVKTKAAFFKLLEDIKNFSISSFNGVSREQCSNCIYSPPCIWSLAND